VDDALDVAIVLEGANGHAGERSVDLHAVDEGGDGDKLDERGKKEYARRMRAAYLVGRDLLEHLVVRGLVEDDGVVGLSTAVR
jgi:hypothetical protein